jgi:hypothetical protein
MPPRRSVVSKRRAIRALSALSGSDTPWRASSATASSRATGVAVASDRNHPVFDIFTHRFTLCVGKSGKTFVIEPLQNVDFLATYRAHLIFPPLAVSLQAFPKPLTSFWKV